MMWNDVGGCLLCFLILNQHPGGGFFSIRVDLFNLSTLAVAVLCHRLSFEGLWRFWWGFAVLHGYGGLS